MIDLENTWVPNVEGERKELFAAECEKQGIPLCSRDTLEQESAYLVVYAGRLCCFEGSQGSKEITLADLKPANEPKPKRVKVSYVGVNGNDKVVAGCFSTETLYYMSSNSHDTNGVQYTEITSLEELSCANVAYRKVEAEIEWFEDIPDGGVLCWVSDNSDENKNNHINLITHYSIDKSYGKFFAGVTNHDGGHLSHKGGWNNAIPLTIGEIDALSLNAPSMTDKPEAEEV